MSFSGKYASSDGRCLIKDGVLLGFAPYGLKEYTIPDYVTEIADGVFWHCSLDSITIPKGVTKIGPNAFCGSGFLRSITCLSIVPPIISAGNTNDFSSELIIFVPKEAVCAYKKNANWAQYSSQIKGIDDKIAH
jgi:hypothetical protein